MDKEKLAIHLWLCDNLKLMRVCRAKVVETNNPSLLLHLDTIIKHVHKEVKHVKKTGNINFIDMPD